MNLLLGNFHDKEIGLLEKTHLRWFTRKTIIDMFETTGYLIQHGVPHIFEEPNRARFLPTLEQMARLVGADPQRAIADCLPLNYVVRAALR